MTTPKFMTTSTRRNSIRRNKFTHKNKSISRHTRTERKHTPRKRSNFAPKKVITHSSNPMPVIIQSNLDTTPRCKFPIKIKDHFPCKFADTVFENAKEYIDYSHSVQQQKKSGNRTSSIKSHYDNLRKRGIVVHNKRKRTIKYTPIPLFSQL